MKTVKETDVRNIPVISTGYSVTHLDFCGDNMLQCLLFSREQLRVLVPNDRLYDVTRLLFDGIKTKKK